MWATYRKEVAETIHAIVGGAQIVFEPPRPGDYRGKMVSAEKAKPVLGWEPRVDYAAGLAATLAWLRDDYLPSAGISYSS